MANEAKPVGQAPVIDHPGTLLEAAGFRSGDEILWINDVEITSPSLATALLKQLVGKVSVIARRAREAPLANWWTAYEAARAALIAPVMARP